MYKLIRYNRMRGSNVMLSRSEASLSQRDRPFAAAQGDSRGVDYETSQYAALASLIIHISF
jgi:hypothetical protein